MLITLSPQTKNLIHSLYPNLSIDHDQADLSDIARDLGSLLAYTDKSNNKQKIQLLTCFLQDIKLHCTHSLIPKNAQAIKPHQDSSTAGFWISIAALIIIGCEGFDGIASVLGLFALNPWITFAVACGVALFSILLNRLVKNLGEQRHYLEQQYSLIYDNAIILEEALNSPQNQNLNEIGEVIQFLRNAKELVRLDIEGLNASRSNVARRAAQYVIMGFLSGIVFCGGFFTGQAVAFFLTSLVVTTTVTAWPVLIPALCVGLAAVSIYIIEQYPTIKNALRHWFGFAVEASSHSVPNEQISEKLNVLELRIGRENQRLDQVARIMALERELVTLKAENSQAILATGKERARGLEDTTLPIAQPITKNRSSPLVNGGFYAGTSDARRLPHLMNKLPDAELVDGGSLLHHAIPFDRSNSSDSLDVTF